MSKSDEPKIDSKAAREVLSRLYAKEGIQSQKLANALHAMNEEMGVLEPRTILVQNLGTTTVDHIEPQAYGVTNQQNFHRHFKRVNVATNEDTSAGGATDNG